jgi:hypothetical protein
MWSEPLITGPTPNILLAVLTSISALLTAIQQPTKSYPITKGIDITGKATKGIWVGSAGTIIAKLSSDTTTSTFNTSVSGTWIPGNFIIITTASTANQIVGLV